MKKLLLLFALVLGLVVGGISGFLLSRWQPAPSAVKAAVRPSESEPSRQELIDYLDGKTVALSQPQGENAESEASHTLQRDQIKAVEAQSTSFKFSDDPWTTPVNLIFDTGEGQYAAELTVQHRLVDGRRAFYGYKVKNVVKQ